MYTIRKKFTVNVHFVKVIVLTRVFVVQTVNIGIIICIDISKDPLLVPMVAHF